MPRLSGRRAGFRGSRIVRATASIEGPGASLIGIFCQADGDMSSGYLALVDPASHGARLARLQDRRAITIAQGPLEYDVALDQPLDLELRCVKRKKVYWFQIHHRRHNGVARSGQISDRR